MPCPPQRVLPNPGIEPRSSALQVDSSPSEPPGKPGSSVYSILNKLNILTSRLINSIAELVPASPLIVHDTHPCMAAVCVFWTEQTLLLEESALHGGVSRASPGQSFCLVIVRRGLSTVNSLPRQPHGAARPNKAHTGPENWPLPATPADKWGGQSRQVHWGAPKVGVGRPSVSNPRP